MYFQTNLKQIIVFSGKIDFRKRFDGLLSLCYQNNYNPYEGDCVVFISRNNREIRVFCGDELGLYLLCRRFDGGRIKSLFSKNEITHGELSFLLQGAQIQVVHNVKPWKKIM